jgi:hypothetical protein
MTLGSQTSAPVITISSPGKRSRSISRPSSVTSVRSVDTAMKWVMRSRARMRRSRTPTGIPPNWYTKAPSDSGTSFKTAPAIGLALADLIVHGTSAEVDIAPFSAARFRGAGSHAGASAARVHADA